MRLTRKQQQQQTRERLLAAAKALIVGEGVTGTTIRGICEAAGHTQGAFYSNFASKDDLLLELMQGYIQHELTMLRQMVATTEGAQLDGALGIIADRLAETASETHWSLMSIELQLQAQRDAAFAERYNASKAACHQHFAALLGDLIARHGLQPALPPAQIAIGLFALWAGLVVQGSVPDALPRDQILLAFFRAVAGCPPQTAPKETAR